MVKLESLIQKDLLTILTGTTKARALEELIEVVNKSRRVPDPAKFRESILYREKLMSTGIGIGVAVPHARTGGLKEPLVAVGISPGGLADYESIDGQTVRIVILVGVGEGKHRQYIELMAQIMKRLKDPLFRDALIACCTAEELYAVFTKN